MTDVDTASPITHVSLCAGYGGIDLGLKRAIPTLRTIAFSEIEAFACANLVAKMEAGLLDPAPIWTDLKTFPWSDFRDRVDILSGGYPCQPFSAAGKRLGQEDPRHLWPFIAAGIAAMRPSCCFFENVEGHISLGLPDVIEDLAGMGYRTTWGVFSASEVGAPHQRKRVFILAHRDGERGFLPDQRRVAAEQVPVGDGEARGDVLADPGHEQSPRRNDIEAGQQPAPRRDARGVSAPCCGGQVWPSRPGEPQHGWEPPRVVGNSESRKDNGREPGDLGGEASQGRCGNDAVDCAGKALANDHSPHAGHGAQRPERQQRDLSGGCGEAGSMGNAKGQRDANRQECTGRTFAYITEQQWQTQPTLGRDLDGPAGRLGYAELCVSCDNRTDELRLLGNGVVPATAERAFRVLMEELMP
jgi:DNA (cytosine-5)-methyltransferase 1